MEMKLRPWVLEDAEELAKALNNKRIQENLRDGLPYPYTAKDAEEYINQMLYSDSKNVFPFAITVQDKAVGSIAVTRRENIHRMTGELGYYVAESYWGKGIATLAIRSITDYVFANTDIIRIFAEPFAYNAASCRALEKAGYFLEGTLRKNAVKNGKIIDMKLYALVKETE